MNGWWRDIEAVEQPLPHLNCFLALHNVGEDWCVVETGSLLEKNANSQPTIKISLGVKYLRDRSCSEGILFSGFSSIWKIWTSAPISNQEHGYAHGVVTSRQKGHIPVSHLTLLHLESCLGSCQQGASTLHISVIAFCKTTATLWMRINNICDLLRM